MNRRDWTDAARVAAATGLLIVVFVVCYTAGAAWSWARVNHEVIPTEHGPRVVAEVSP